MMKKPTLRDVAREACVSVATASYVLNNVSNQTIQEETRKRVHEAAAKLGYVQNLTARALSIGKTNVLGVLLTGDDSDLISRLISYGKFIDQLEQISLERQYRLMFARIDPRRPNLDIILERKLDGVFVIDASEQSFHAVAGNFSFGSPVVLVDGMLSDPLFRCVVYDAGQLFAIVRTMCGGEPYAIVHERYYNRSATERLHRESGVPGERIWCATRDIDALREFARRQRGRPLLVMNEFLALHLLEFVPPADMIVACTSECPEFLPSGVKRIVAKDGKAKIASELMHMLLKDPYAAGLGGILSFEAGLD